MIRTCRLVLDVDYDDRYTDPEALSDALSLTLATSLSTKGLLDDCGDVTVSDLSPLDEEVFD